MGEFGEGSEQRVERDVLLAALPDLSADTVEQLEALAQTPWFASVKIPLARMVPEEEALCSAVESRLLGRDPSAIYTTAKDELWVNFALESGNDEVRDAVSGLVGALAGLVGASGIEPELMYAVRYIDTPFDPPLDYERIKRL